MESRGQIGMQYKSFVNTMGKGEIALTEQFLLFPHCFLPVWRTFCHFHQIQNCYLQALSVWKSLKSVFWERVKTFHHTVVTFNDHEEEAFRKLCWKSRKRQEIKISTLEHQINLSCISMLEI